MNSTSSKPSGAVRWAALVPVGVVLTICTTAPVAHAYDILGADVVGSISNNVRRWTASGTPVDSFSSPPFYDFKVPGGAWPITVATNANRIYVSSFNEPGTGPNRVYRLHLHGTLDTSFNGTGSVALSVGGVDYEAAPDMTIGPDQALYVAVDGPSVASDVRVVRVDPMTGAVSAFVTHAGSSIPRGLVFGPDTNLYLSTVASAVVNRFNGLSGAFINTALAYTPNSTAGVEIPRGLDFDAAGNLYVMDNNCCGGDATGLYRIRRFDSSLSYLGDWTYGSWDSPFFVKVAPDGVVFSSDVATGHLLKWSAAGVPTLFVNNGEGLASIAFVPEPSSLVLLGFGMALCLGRRIKSTSD